MRKAYDTILQSEVSAELAAQNGGFEPYRYECACCGEEVFVAAPFSNRMVAHFRHRSGNNDVECENYLGQYGAISTDSSSRRNNRERAEFYYDSTSKTFSLAVRFSESEIQSYEQKSVDFELRAQDLDTPLRVLKINSMNFSPDVPTLIPLNNFSFSYYSSNTLNGIKRKYDFLNRDNTPTFFKILGNDDDFKAKLVRSTVLFTNTNYFVAIQSQYSAPRGVQFPKGIEVGQTFRFETMNRKFLGIVLSIANKTPSIDCLLKSWGYQLEASETLTLLWPPAHLIDDASIIVSDCAFIFSSFELQAHGNINLHSDEIIKLSNGISKVMVKPKTKIFKKNAEIVIEKVAPPVNDYSVIAPSKSLVSTFTVPDDGIYYLFNHSGVSPLTNGQVVFLTPNSSIVRYKFNYPVGYIYPCLQKELTGEELLEDILVHYKRMEAFDSTRFSKLVLSKTTSKYIEKCKITGSINPVVMQFIEEGQL
ncbi:hypothetical protein EHV15_10670 [Paenibacillus oralis]|uniref:Uncharacterized protein n=1 Tax=Paenibacillus oralis TaxID=2490856 RepID=A0A3P3U136_9BACL|nr:hypothetical protein [Paenibacillus oralis]RRJ63329.1 hypothetical protein EHV15_10670 [Paenibacillus oralis]